jgi:hypothetical protein
MQQSRLLSARQAALELADLGLRATTARRRAPQCALFRLLHQCLRAALFAAGSVSHRTGAPGRGQQHDRRERDAPPRQNQQRHVARTAIRMTGTGCPR